METGPAILYHLQQSQSLPVKMGATQGLRIIVAMDLFADAPTLRVVAKHDTFAQCPFS
jgi:hypothetical protein